MIFYIFILVIIVVLVILFLEKKVDDIDFERIHKERAAANAPKILYLRGFKVDGDDGSNGNISMMRLMSKETDLAKALINFNYHLVAVGKPDEKVPNIGFDRRIFSHDEWQGEVLKLMMESHLIIWRPDTTPGVLWEIGKLLDLDCRPKLIIWAEMGYENMIDLQKRRYNVFKRKVSERFSEEFPSFDRYKKFLVSNARNEWNIYQSLHQVPYYMKIVEQEKQVEK